MDVISHVVPSPTQYTVPAGRRVRDRRATDDELEAYVAWRSRAHPLYGDIFTMGRGASSSCGRKLIEFERYLAHSYRFLSEAGLSMDVHAGDWRNYRRLPFRARVGVVVRSQKSRREQGRWCLGARRWPKS